MATPSSIGGPCDAAGNHELIRALCILCFRGVTYLASDLVQILDPNRDAQAPPFQCGRCGTEEHIKVTLRMPEPGDYGAIPTGSDLSDAVKACRTFPTKRVADAGRGRNED
jgi:hypothetical protein